LVKDRKQVSLPAFNAQLGRYEAREIKDDNDLVLGQFGIQEPKSTCPLADLGALDLVLAPGIAFALDGTRLGRGKGYYDRLLEKVQASKIGVCFDWQVLPQIPRDGHDILMDYLATPTPWRSSNRLMAIAVVVNSAVAWAIQARSKALDNEPYIRGATAKRIRSYGLIAVS